MSRVVKLYLNLSSTIKTAPFWVLHPKVYFGVKMVLSCAVWQPGFRLPSPQNLKMPWASYGTASKHIKTFTPAVRIANLLAEYVWLGCELATPLEAQGISTVPISYTFPWTWPSELKWDHLWVPTVPCEILGIYPSLTGFPRPDKLDISQIRCRVRRTADHHRWHPDRTEQETLREIATSNRPWC